MSLRTKHTGLIKAIARDLGFDYCGIAKAQKLDDDARRLENWLNKGMHGNMSYMERYFDLRIDPTQLVPGAKSVITLLINYYPKQAQDEHAPRVARYAFGKDYHDVIREKLNRFFLQIKDQIGEIQGRGFTDSAPVLERSWAQASGLGWVGRNGNLITKENGSYFFIATLITDLDLDYDDAFAKDYCGTCTKCVDACPTDAILPDKVVDGSKCISYFTIELKDTQIPENMTGKFENWIFGCDICQEVCPWNRFAKPLHEKEFEAIPEILHYTGEQWELLNEKTFRHLFKDSPLRRAKFSGITRNLQFIKLS